MAKKDQRIPIDEPIPSLDTPWDDGEYAYTGARVEEFIKGKLQQIQPPMEVDEDLNAESTRPVQNRTIAARLQELEQGTVYQMDTEALDDDSGVMLTLRSKHGVIAEAEIPALGSGSGDNDSTAIRVTARVDRQSVLEGGAVQLTYSYDNVYSSGDDKGMSTGQPATITVTVKRGETVALRRSEHNCSCGDYSMDLSPYLQPGNNDVYVEAQFYDSRLDKVRTKQAWVQVTVVAFHLSSDFTLTPQLQGGGYGSSATIPYTVSGNGTKRIYLYLDGEQRAYKDISASAPTTDSFTVNVSSLSPGMHSVQLVGRLNVGGVEYASESVWMTLIKQGASAAVGLVLTNSDGRIVEGTGHMSPTLTVRAFDETIIRYGVYDSAHQTAQAEILIDGVPVQSVSAPRTQQTYRHRFTQQGQHTLTVRCGSASQNVGVEVTPGSVSVQEATGGLLCRLDATGRSNSETNPAVWTDGTTTVEFEGVDFSSSGWTGKALRLMGGARATVGIQPFAVDNGITGPRAEGLTIEATVTISDITDPSASLISCISGGKGLRVMGNEIAFLTGQTITYIDEDNVEQTRESKLSTNYVDGRRMKIALIIRKAVKEAVEAGQTVQLPDRVMELYIDGNRAGADTYESSYSFAQTDPAPLVFDSTGATIEIEKVRVYSRALTDDEELMNDIYDEPDPAEMYSRYTDNDILDSDGAVDINAILRKGKGAIKIVRSSLLEDVYATNDKNIDFTADVYYYSPLGSQYNFVLQGCYIRIQGTSSTKYPSKNIRIYFNKGAGEGKKPLSFEVNNVPVPSFKYALRPGAAAQGVMTAKSDYSDSSMSLNTGGAKLFNAAMIELGLLTPPQQWQQEQGLPITARQSIDGIPVDMFVAATAESTPIYMGQYNFNNEKSKSEEVFGMVLSGTEFSPSCPIALEALNNLQDLCLFKTGGDLEAKLNNTFDSAFEFNYPEDVFWSQAKLDDKGKGTLATDAQRTAIRRLMTFIRDSVPAGADPGNISTFDSPYFRAHVSEYFDVPHLLTYYDFTDRFVSVDQRAKNIMWRTWDGLKWYATYYDGDTARGKRNDSFMVYGPETDRNTWDTQRKKYAFEGYESWLWCLVLANLQSELAAASRELGRVLGVERVLNMLLVEQSGNWSDRAFNKSGELKYITPAIRTTYGKTWPFIFALQGADRSHSEWFIRERWKLMDAKYAAGQFTADDLPVTLSRSADDPADYITVTMAKLYASGYGTNNDPNIYSTGIIDAGVPARMPVTVGLNANDPIRIYGASRIRRIDMTECHDRMQGSFDVAKAVLLEEIDMHVPVGKTGYSRSWWLAGIENCRLLRILDLTGQAEASTSSTSHSLDLQHNINLQQVLAHGTAITSFDIAPGAAVHTLQLPGTLASLTLRSLHNLASAGLDLEGYSSLRSVEVTGCEHVDELALVRTWLSNVTTADSLTLENINWRLDTDDVLMEMVTKITTLNISGQITVVAPMLESHEGLIKAKLGDDCMTPDSGNPLHITADPTVIMNDTTNPRMMEIMRAHGFTSGSQLTKAQAAAVVQTGNGVELRFAPTNNNTTKACVQRWDPDEVVTFNELKYFTGFNGYFSIDGLPVSEVTLPPNITYLYSAANTKLKRLTIPDRVETIRQTSLVIPTLEKLDLNNINNIENTGLAGATSLKEIICRGSDLPNLQSNYAFGSGTMTAGCNVAAGEKFVKYTNASEARLSLWNSYLPEGWTLIQIQ